MSLDHIESRLTKKKGSQFDIILQCTGNKDTITSLTNTLRQSNSISDIWIGNENIVQKKGATRMLVKYSNNNTFTYFQKSMTFSEKYANESN